MKTNKIKLTENTLKHIVTESVKRILKEYVENYNDGLQFIDRYEIEDMLSEYYDFSMVDMETWKLIDQLVKSECEKRGVSPDDYEQYARVCDVCVGKVLD